MLNITKAIQQSLERISNKSFAHLHELDLNYHKIESRNSVFAINRALRSIESGLRYFLGFFSGMVVEFGFLSFALGAYCGPLYLANMVATFFAYLKYTRSMGKERIGQVRAKKKFEKKQEFF